MKIPKYLYWVGRNYDPSKITKVRNRRFCAKASGGLFTCLDKSWLYWLHDYHGYIFPLPMNKFLLDSKANILKIHSKKDAIKLPQRPYLDETTIDFDLLNHYDAIWIKYISEMNPPYSWGWDVETMLIINPEVITLTKTELV